MIISFLIVAGPAFSQDPVFYDSSDIEIRHLQYDKIKSYSVQKEFDYREKNAKSLSLWDRFWHWFWEQFYRKALTGESQQHEFLHQLPGQQADQWMYHKMQVLL